MSVSDAGLIVGRVSAAVCFVLDLLLVISLCVVIAVILTGGAAFDAGSVRVRVHGVDNPLWLLTAAVVLRYAIRRPPFLGNTRWPVESFFRRGPWLLLERVMPWLSSRFVRPVVAVAVLTGCVFAVRLLLAGTSPGFFSGDDVEIHDLTLGILLRKAWPVWDLRCAFFPMIFVYPAQWLALTLGRTSPQALVFAGRVLVAFVSSMAIPLLWMTARQLRPSEPRMAIIAVLLFAINKLQMSFGSSELPRPVSTVFVLAAFLCLLRQRRSFSALGGVLLGVAVACRFSETAFLPAAFITAAAGRRWSNAAVVLVMSGITAAAIIAVSDALYWGRPMSSVVAAINYTVIERQSSRGFEPFWEYLRLIPAWSTFVFVGLAIAGSSRRTPDSWWLWTPIAILSALPHKESRYLLPTVPFLCLGAARGMLRMADWLRHSTDVIGWRRVARELFAPALIIAVLHDIGGWRLSRSNEGIRLAEYLRATGGRGVAAQDVWRLGGHPYLSPLEPLINVTPELLNDHNTLANAVGQAKWVALRYRVARTTGDGVLRVVGFVRDPEWWGEDYVLYVRER
jgi:hypothetical protein